MKAESGRRLGRASAATFLALFLGGVSLPAGYVSSNHPIRVVVDTDAGSDDLMALAYLLARTEVSIEAVTVVHGLAHVPAGASNILRLFDLVQAPQIPVFAGETAPLKGKATFPDEWRELTDALPGITLPETRRQVEKRSAVHFLRSRLQDAGPPGTRLLALGPLTNIAKALGKSRSFPGIESIIAMGGAIEAPGNLGDGGYFRTRNQVAEWNMYLDPEAARRVFSAGIPVTLVPLDATNRVPIDSAFVRFLAASARTPLQRLVARLLEAQKDLIEKNAFYAWDPLAAVALTNPEILRVQDLHLEIETRAPREGQTRRTEGRKPNARVALGADAEAFTRIFTEALGAPR